jgi:hypothetical protein
LRWKSRKEKWSSQAPLPRLSWKLEHCLFSRNANLIQCPLSAALLYFSRPRSQLSRNPGPRSACLPHLGQGPTFSQSHPLVPSRCGSLQAFKSLFHTPSFTGTQEGKPHPPNPMHKGRRKQREGDSVREGGKKEKGCWSLFL